ncbi:MULTISPECIES: hypothetical protein [unclassified Bradyrhizobium]|uniref:hypothetical protein n=1 Tax=unclassified Bradyrhizobium TaxID=2631580 RepID=UPI0028E2B9B4|nr:MULTISPECIES: hypothetical protein [unclassified Bradyrhizobium]
MFATKMVLAAVTPADTAGETTSSLIREPIPGVDTLSESDRSFETPPVDLTEGARLPLISKAVRAESRGASVARRAKVTSKKTVMRPATRNAEPLRSAAAPCKQLDPIARFLASAKIGPRCQA